MTTKPKNKITLWLESNESLIRWLIVVVGAVLILAGEPLGKYSFEFSWPWADAAAKLNKFNTNNVQVLGFLCIFGPPVYKLIRWKFKSGKA